MNKKEVAEIRKQFTQERCTITRLCSCYVDSEKQKRMTVSRTFLNLPEEELFKYLEIFKKTLSGTIGKNLQNLDFPMEQEHEGGAQNDLMKLRETKLEDEELVEGGAVGAIDIADEAEVDAFGGDGAAVGADEVEVGAGEAQGIDAARLELSDDVLVDEAGIDHGHHVEHGGVGDASSADHPAFDAELRRHLRCGASAAVDEHLGSFNLREPVEQDVELRGIFNDGASDLNDGKMGHGEWGMMIDE